MRRCHALLGRSERVAQPSRTPMTCCDAECGAPPGARPRPLEAVMAAGPTRRAVLVASAPEAVIASGLTRRAVLAGAATAVPVLISGCRGVEVLGHAAGPGPRRPAAAGDHSGRAAADLPLSRRPRRASEGCRRPAARGRADRARAASGPAARRLVVPVGSAQSVAPAATPAVSTPPDLAGALGQPCPRPSRPPRSGSPRPADGAAVAGPAAGHG